MKLAIKAYAVTLILLMLVFAVPAQDKLSEKENRNTAPTVGTGGAVGGPTGLFTVYDGHTLRKGEYTLSLALSNYDRDPGNADITSVPVSFQFGVTNHLELFFNTEAYRGIKINSPRNLSSFYLPNTGGAGLGAIVLAPGTTGPYAGQAVFRPPGMPFAAYPFTGANAGNYQLVPQGSGSVFGFAGPVGTNATLGPPRAGGNAALYPGVGSVFGSILPGVVLSTTTVGGSIRPVSFSTRPSYLNDAPFISRTWGTSSFNTLDFGFKWRINDTKSAVGYGFVGFYRWYMDKAKTPAGFNMMQRGSGPGGNRGDLGGSFFVDGRLATWANLSANIGYTFVTNPKDAAGFVMLDRPDEFSWSLGADFPVNKYFQPILEFRSLRYVRSRTPNAFEQNPLDGLAGVRIFPRRWFGLSLAYRHNFNQQDRNYFKSSTNSTTVLIPCPNINAGCAPVTTATTVTGVPSGFAPSTDPHGYIAQFFIGRRDERAGDIENKPASVDSVSLSSTVITLPCRPGYRSKSGNCSDNRTIKVSTKATDPENDVLTYNYTVSGGRIVGGGANVDWDLSSAQPGTYTITTGVDDGCGVCGKTDTRTIKVEECPDCVQVCQCATISMSGPSGVTIPGDKMTFTANVSGGTGDPTYNWSVSAGTISSGQGTSSITVDTAGLAGQNVTATVDVGGLCPECPRTASETAGVKAPEISTVVDEFGALKDDDVKARVDSFFITLNNNPNAQGYIINYGTPAQIKARRAQIMKAINFRKYDVSRVTFVDGPDNGSGVNTKFYLVPAGVTPPTP